MTGDTCFIFHIFVLLMIFLFKMAPKHSAEVLSDVPKHRMAAMCLMEKIHVLNELH